MSGTIILARPDLSTVPEENMRRVAVGVGVAYVSAGSGFGVRDSGFGVLGSGPLE